MLHSVRFQDPDYGEDHVFEPKLLEGVTMPERTLKPQGYQGNYSPRVGFSYQSGSSQVNTEAAQRTIRCESVCGCTMQWFDNKHLNSV